MDADSVNRRGGRAAYAAKYLLKDLAQRRRGAKGFGQCKLSYLRQYAFFMLISTI